MKRSTFFKSIIAGVAVFLGYKAKPKSLFSERFSIGMWIDPDGKFSTVYHKKDDI